MVTSSTENTAVKTNSPVASTCFSLEVSSQGPTQVGSSAARNPQLSVMNRRMKLSNWLDAATLRQSFRSGLVGERTQKVLLLLMKLFWLLVLQLSVFHSCFAVVNLDCHVPNR
mgnify:CR=1 FL=1